MKRSVKILLFLYFLLIQISCVDNSIHKFKLENYPIDNTKEIKLKINSKITLEETNNVILNSITSVSLNDSNNRILVGDEASNIAIVYNLKNGKIESYFKGTKDIADSVAQSGILPGPYSVLNGRKARYVPMKKRISEFKEKNLDMKGATMWYSSSVMCAKYFHNQIYIICHILCPARPLDTIKKYSSLIGNLRGLIVLDKSLKMEKVFPLGQNTDSFQIECHSSTLASDFIIKNNTNKVICTALDEICLISKSLLCINSLNEYDAQCKKYDIVGYLPNEYLYSKIGLYYDWQPKLLQIANNVYCCYPLCKTIYKIEDKQKPAFELSNLPFNNDKGLVFLQNFDNMEKYMGPNRRFLDKFMLKLLPLYVWKMININDNIGVLVSVCNKQSKSDTTSTYIIQEYQSDGRLLKYSNIIFENENGILSNVEYNNFSKELLIFRKHNEKGWIMERAKWN